jgi:hypothetical protein
MPEVNNPKPIGPVKPEIQAAEYLDLSPTTLEADRRTGRLGIPFIKIGRRIGYLFSDLDLWLVSHRHTPNNKD